MRKPIDLISPSFTSDLSQKYSLSIRQNPNGYSFCVKSICDDNKCVAIRYLPIESNIRTSALLTAEQLLQLKYGRIQFFGYGTYMLLPDKFELADYATLLSIHNTIKKRDRINTGYISNDIRIIYPTSRWLFPKTDSIELHHEMELLLSTALNGGEDTGVWVEILTEHINIVIVANGQLKLGNTYHISTDMDIAYYILACYQQLDLATETTCLFVCGETAGEEVMKVLSSYIRHIEIKTPELWKIDLTEDKDLGCFTLQTIATKI